jgi:hypothetical protein
MGCDGSRCPVCPASVAYGPLASTSPTCPQPRIHARLAPRSAGLPSRPLANRPRLLAPFAALALAVALGGCTRDPAEPAPAVTSAPATTTPRAISVRVRASASGDGRGPALTQAAKTATPELEGFLTRYLTIALDPAAATGGYAGLRAFFDPALRKAVARDLRALSLGPGGARVTAVSARPASAATRFLIQGSRPIAATVRLSVDGTVAGTEGAAAPLQLRAVFHLERTGSGWRIVDYTSQGRTPA